MRDSSTKRAVLVARPQFLTAWRPGDSAASWSRVRWWRRCRARYRRKCTVEVTAHESHMTVLEFLHYNPDSQIDPITCQSNRIRSAGSIDNQCDRDNESGRGGEVEASAQTA